MNKINVGVIVLNWNGKVDTIECLASVAASKTKTIDLRVYVVDNASEDGSVKAFKKQFPDFTYIVNQKNLGFSGGNNVGVYQAIADGAAYVILLNNDTTVAPDTFERLVVGAKKHQFDIASPKIYFYPGREFHHQHYQRSERGKVIWYAGGRNDWANVIPKHIGVDEVDHGQWQRPQETEFASGCCMLIDRKVVKAIGGLDDTFRAYFEDNDYCMKARRRGFTIGYIPDSKMWHKNAGSSGGSGSKTQVDLVDRSRFIFAMRYSPLRAKLAIIRNRLRNRRG